MNSFESFYIAAAQNRHNNLNFAFPPLSDYDKDSLLKSPFAVYILSPMRSYTSWVEAFCAPR